MAGGIPKGPRVAVNSKSRRGIEEPVLIRRILIGIAVGFVGVFLLLPLANVFAQAFAKGWSAYLQSLQQPDTRSAVLLTLLVSAICVPLNLVFGVIAAW
ncbi:MAG: sulfate/thiosulfate ABC transporter permease CysW, partial [Verrucomicrobia bacterium]|nr:sulfate/thiosulfate ABC transporter permease CysW [Verrucomicrobiota bacterium]